jgi:hypothetical protein
MPHLTVWIVKLIFTMKNFVTAVNLSDISNVKDMFHCARFEVLIVINMKITGSQCFRETYCIHEKFVYSLLGCDSMQDFKIMCHLKAMVNDQCLLLFSG